MLGESKDIIDYLQRKGTVQVEKCDAPESMYYTDTDSSVSQLERLLQTAENARETISFYSPEKKKLTDSFLPRKEVELSDFYEESEKTDVAMAKCREIIDIKKEIADKKADIIREQTAREALIPWERLDIPPNTTGTRHTEVFVGSLPDECTEEALKAGFAAALPDLTAIDCEVVSSSNTQSIIVVICLKKDSRRVYDYLRSLNFVRASGGDNENIKAAMERHGKNIEALSSDIDGDEEKIRELSSYREDIDFLIDFLTIRKDKYEAFKKMSLSRNVFYFEGYIPERYCEKTVKGLEERFTVAVTISDVPEDDENEPVLLKNNDFAAPVEEITEMYALPGKHDIDPNAIMAFFYYCFFGMMFSDAGYGLIMFLATLFILLKCKPEGQKRKTVMMYMYCGISTMFWGIMFGSFFGDIINIVRYDFIGLPKIRLYAWLDPQEQLIDHHAVVLFVRRCSSFCGRRHQGIYGVARRAKVLGGMRYAVRLPCCRWCASALRRYDYRRSGGYKNGRQILRNSRRNHNSPHGRQGVKVVFRQNRLRTLRRVQHDFGLSQRYSFIRKAFGTRTCYRHNRQRSQYDGCFAEQ